MREIIVYNKEVFDQPIVVVTTNGYVKPDGTLAMGKGIAAEVKKRFPSIEYKLGGLVVEYGNKCFIIMNYYVGKIVISFPTKHHWLQKSDIKLIEKSCIELVEICTHYNLRDVYLPRPGCSNGGLDWHKEVKSVVSKILDDNFIVYKRHGDKE